MQLKHTGSVSFTGITLTFLLMENLDSDCYSGPDLAKADTVITVRHCQEINENVLFHGPQSRRIFLAVLFNWHEYANHWF